MGKPDKHEMKHSKAINGSKQKLKAKKDAFNCKRAATIASSSGGKRGTDRVKRGEAGKKLLKKKLSKMKVDELMEGNFMDNISTEDEGNLVEGVISHNDEVHSKDGKDYIDITPDGLDEDDSKEQEEDDNEFPGQKTKHLSESRKHKKQLERLKEKDPEFFEFLKDHDKELLQFSDEDSDGYEEDDNSAKEQFLKPSDGGRDDSKDLKQPAKKVLTTATVDTWCKAILEDQSLSALRSILRAFRTACHYGDSGTDDSGSNLSIMTSNVFNKIMVFVLSEMDGILRRLLTISSSGGKGENILELKGTKRWRNFGHLVKSYLSNALHVMNQMTDNQMISFTIRRLRSSVIFLAAFPALLRKYLKVALHFWGTGEGALSVVSFLFIRDLAIRLGSDCLDACLKGIYKDYVANCKFVNSGRLQHIQFLSNCVVELYGVDLSSTYQHSFVFIRQMAMILRNALTVKTKEAFKKVYSWKFMNCLDVWVKVLCTHSTTDDLQPLAYPLVQIISGVARLVPTARYFPLRVQCAKMLNRLASATMTFIPVASLLVDMLEFKELNRPPTGGIGKAIDFSITLKVPKPTLKTRAFQEECVSSVIEQLAEHLTLWSYSVAFPELAFIPAVRLRQFKKETKVDRFRRQVKQLIDQIESNIEYVGKKRTEISFSPKDHVPVSSFLQAEKESGTSPLSQYLLSLRQRAEQRKASLRKSSVQFANEETRHSAKGISVASDEDDYGDIEEGAEVFSKDWLPEKKSNREDTSKSIIAAKSHTLGAAANEEDDIVETLEFSSDEEDDDAQEEKDDDDDGLGDYVDHSEDLGDQPSDKKQKRNKGKSKKKFMKAAKSHVKSKKPGKRRRSRKKQKLSQ